MNTWNIVSLITPLPPIVKGGRGNLLFVKGAGARVGRFDFIKGMNAQLLFNS